MKTGILTFHRALSFGANLQCYALLISLQRIGYIASVLDYRQSYIEEHYKPISIFAISKLIRHPKSLIKYIIFSPSRIVTFRKFRLFQKKYLPCMNFNGKDLPQEIDVLIIGSDQMWSTNYTGGKDDCYLGNINHNINQKIVTYALSANEKSMNEIGDENFITYSKNFTKISFREENIADIFHNMTGRKASICLDPTLLTTERDWKILFDVKWAKRKYIAVYQVHPVGDSFDKALNFARKIAFERNMRVLDINAMSIGPDEFVSIIKYAQMVITTSFHGTVFSILFHKEFVTLKVNDTIDARAKSILKRLELSNRMIDYKDTTPDNNIDYSKVDLKLEELRVSSLEYLKQL